MKKITLFIYLQEATQDEFECGFFIALNQLIWDTNNF
jgi:hypothetical protein